MWRNFISGYLIMKLRIFSILYIYPLFEKYKYNIFLYWPGIAGYLYIRSGECMRIYKRVWRVHHSDQMAATGYVGNGSGNSTRLNGLRGTFKLVCICCIYISSINIPSFTFLSFTFMQFTFLQVILVRVW